MTTRERIHLPRHIGDRIADAVTSTMGSWRFIIIQTAILCFWAFLNSVAWFVWKWDIYPFIAMNLLLSCQAAYASPLILMSQGRQADKDRQTAKIEEMEVQKIFETHELLLNINNQQLDILRLLKEVKEKNAHD